MGPQSNEMPEPVGLPVPVTPSVIGVFRRDALRLAGSEPVRFREIAAELGVFHEAVPSCRKQTEVDVGAHERLTSEERDALASLRRPVKGA
jgi:hypothetical protein